VAKDSTALPLFDDRSSRAENLVTIVGDVTFESSPLAGTGESSPSMGTAAASRALASAPMPIQFVVALKTENVVLQVWEGTVTNLANDEFTAIIRDKTEEGNPDEEVVLSTDELAVEDLPLLRPGAIFYWSVRYEQERGLPRRRVSRIRFRRVPGWTNADIRQSEVIKERLRGIWTKNAEDITRE
jgi:hypothetical protein